MNLLNYYFISFLNKYIKISIYLFSKTGLGVILWRSLQKDSKLFLIL